MSRDAVPRTDARSLPLQHGPHLPLGVDAYIAAGVAERVAREVGALVAPVLSYGYKSVPCMVRDRPTCAPCPALAPPLMSRRPRAQGGGPFIGTTGLDGSTLTAQLRDVVRELVRHGVRRLLLLDGHFENQMFTIEAANLVRPAVRVDTPGFYCADLWSARRR